MAPPILQMILVGWDKDLYIAQVDYGPGIKMYAVEIDPEIVDIPTILVEIKNKVEAAIAADAQAAIDDSKKPDLSPYYGRDIS